MEVVFRGSRADAAATELISPRQPGIVVGNRWRRAVRNQIDFDPARVAWTRRLPPLGLRAVRSEMGVEKLASLPSKKNRAGRVRLFVGLPLDAISNCNSLNHAKAIATGLRALKLLGIHGVELPIWWGIAQPESSTDGTIDWSAYLNLTQLVREAGLRVSVSLNLHCSEIPSIPFPRWISRISDTNPDILFADRAGLRRRDCLSFAVDELPVLNGQIPMEAFEDFFLSFKSAFFDLIGSTITEISVGLGPGGELRYPSFPPLTRNHPSGGIGQFQCYDKYMLASLKRRAEEIGNPLWGLGGPHDAPEYNQALGSTSFFRETSGSWEMPYGDFFLSWYSGELLLHGDRLLSLGSKVFGDFPVRLSAKVPLVPYWYKTRSHPAELTAGFYNTQGRDGYDAVAEMFARNHFAMIVPGLDLADSDQTQDSQWSPELLHLQIMAACRRHGVRMSSENSLLAKDGGIDRIMEHLLSENSPVDSFTYQRMGAFFFSPDHFPLFTEFVRGLALPELGADDVVNDEEGKMSLPIGAMPGNDREIQAV